MINPTNLNTASSHQVLAKQGADFFNAGEYAKAHRAYLEALLLVPDEKRYKFALIKCWQMLKIQGHNPRVKHALMLCLTDEDIPPQSIADTWLQALFFDPDMADFQTFTQCENYAAFKTAFQPGQYAELLNMPYFILGLRKCVVKHFRLERALSWLRRYYLQEADKEHKQAVRPFLCALASYAFLGDYILPYDESESAYVGKYATDFARLSSIDQIILASYKPLYQFSEATDLFDKAVQQQLEDVLALTMLQIDEPLEELEARQQVELVPHKADQLTPEAILMPYPRWSGAHAGRFAQRRRKIDQPLEVLFIGCGTAQHVTMAAQHMPKAHIDAVDSSLTDLAYAQRRVNELNIPHINFICADLADLPGRKRRYDLINGDHYLQTVKDPREAITQMAACLKPEGVMRFNLLNSLSRININYWRTHAQSQGYTDDYDGINLLRHDIFTLDVDPQYKRIVIRPELYNYMGCKNLFFPSHENAYSCGDIIVLLEGLGLKILSLDLANPAMQAVYKQRFPEDFTMRKLSNWQKIEQEFPGQFLNGYQLVLARSDSYHADDLPAWYQAS